MKMEERSQKQVENTVGKGEIARYEQFLLFPQCFRKTCTADTFKPGTVWERVKVLAVTILEQMHENLLLDCLLSIKESGRCER